MITCILLSCHPENLDPGKNDASKQISVLIIGNSYSRDAFSYVPYIIESSLPSVSVELDILQIGGVSLDTHLGGLLDGSPIFILDKYTSGKPYWTSKGDISANAVMGKQDWDMIILQEGGIVARSYDVTRSNVSGVVGYCKLFYPKVPVYYMLNPTHPVGSDMLGEYDSDEELTVFAGVAEQLVSDGLVDNIIPCGTAIQLARRTYLDNLGDFGHLSYDGRHLQEGLPCMIEAFTAAQYIMDVLRLEGSIEDCQLKVNQSWVSSSYIPGQHGSVIDGSDDDYALCKRCALNAIASPLEAEFKLLPLRDEFPFLFNTGGFILEAHRGFSDEYPENTDIAFRSAGYAGAFKAIETDVQMTKDNVLVCMHDNSIDRTTDGKGKISDYTLSELRSFHISGGNGWNDEYKGKLTIPTLDDFLTICQTYGKIPYIELKSLSEKGIQKTIELIHSKGFKDGAFVITSFDLNDLKHAAKYCNSPLEYMKSSSFSDREIIDYSRMKNFVLRPPSSKVTREFVDMCHAWGILVEAYGIGTRDKTLMEKLTGWGVTGGTCNSWKNLGFDESNS